MAEMSAPVTLCEECFPDWTSHEIYANVPIGPCQVCRRMDERNKNGLRCHLFPRDPRQQSNVATSSRPTVVQFPNTSLANAPQKLRQLADDIESGTYGDTTAVAVVLFADRTSTFGFGRGIVGPEEAELDNLRALAVDTEALKREWQRGFESGVESTRTIYSNALRGLNAEVLSLGSRIESVLTVPTSSTPIYKSPDVSPIRCNTIPSTRAAAQNEKNQSVCRILDRVANLGLLLPKAHRLILTALAQYPLGRTKMQIAVLTGYAVNGGGFQKAIGSLRSAGYVTRGKPIEITDAGINALGYYEPLPHGRALIDHWMKRLGKAERKILEAVAGAYPCTLSKSQIAARAGYEASGGDLMNALCRLRTLGLVHGSAEIKASDDLFD